MISACGRCRPVPRFAVGHCVTAAMVNGRGQGGGRWPVVLCSAVPWLFVRGQDREETWSKSQSFPSPKFLNPMGHRPRHAQTGVASNSSALWGNANSSARRFSSTSHKHTTAITGDESTAAVMAPRRSIAACSAMPNTRTVSRTVFLGLTWSASRHSDHWPASFSVVARLISTVALCTLHWPQQAGLERARCMANARLDFTMAVCFNHRVFGKGRDGA